jgi:hypothetical protein
MLRPIDGCDAIETSTAPQTLPDAAFDPLARFEGQLRLLPLAAGVAGIAGTLLNRLLSGVRVQDLRVQDLLPALQLIVDDHVARRAAASAAAAAAAGNQCPCKPPRHADCACALWCPDRGLRTCSGQYIPGPQLAMHQLCYTQPSLFQLSSGALHCRLRR